jgi:hypothetical protein
LILLVKARLLEQLQYTLGLPASQSN